MSFSGGNGGQGYSDDPRYNYGPPQYQQHQLPPFQSLQRDDSPHIAQNGGQRIAQQTIPNENPQYTQHMQQIQHQNQNAYYQQAQAQYPPLTFSAPQQAYYHNTPPQSRPVYSQYNEPHHQPQVTYNVQGQQQYNMALPTQFSPSQQQYTQLPALQTQPISRSNGLPPTSMVKQRNSFQSDQTSNDASLYQPEPSPLMGQPADSTSVYKQGTLPPIAQPVNFAPVYKETYIPPPIPRKSSFISQLDGAKSSPVSRPGPIVPPRSSQTSLAQTSRASSQVISSKVLTSLAEEFFSEAHRMAATLAQDMDRSALDTYQKLIATGLGCLETCLLNLELQPRLQAKLRLRLAAVMYEETENWMEMEICLSKGIKLCQQHNYFDLQYSMTYLMARILFKNSPKSALKFLDTTISNAELYRHYSWVYALRFLRVDLSLQMRKLSVTNAAIQHLQSIAALAFERADRAVHCVASIQEAIAHLSSPGFENIEHANRALATARTYQLDLGDKIPQVTFLIHCLDITTSFLYSPQGDSQKKLRSLQVFMDQSKMLQAEWNKVGGMIAIPVVTDTQNAQTVSSDARAVIDITSTGQHLLMLSFLGQQDALAFTNLLSAILMTNKDVEKDRAAQYLKQTHLFFADPKRTRQSELPLAAVLQTARWRSSISAYAHVYQIFGLAMKTRWAEARSRLDELIELLPSFDDKDGPLSQLCLYLNGVCHQGTGELDLALAAFQHEKLTLVKSDRFSLAPRNRVKQDLSILALMNSIWIMQEPRRRDVVRTGDYVEALESLCARHPDKEMQTAFDIIKASIITNPPTTHIQEKNYLRSALARANATKNAQFLSIIFNIMCTKFFDGVVGEQAMKSAQTAKVYSHRSGNMLWQSVAHGLVSHNFETHGMNVDAQQAYEKGSSLAVEAFGKSA